MSPEKQQRPGGEPEALASRWTTCEQDTPRGTESPNNTRARCLLCARRITDPRSIAHGYGPVCWTRMATAQRHERAEALHGRLWALLRRLPDLDVEGLALVSAALDDAVDALDAAGGAR